tara:strand:- start:493 stop:963 length:471 start_codon:yes stop_codon:yes gene_type:complete
MKLHVEWNRLVQLKDAQWKNLIYEIDLEKLPRSPGVYVFGRKWGNSFEALYIGKAKDIRIRVRSQLNNLSLMQHIRHAKSGSRVLLAGQFISKPGQKEAKCLGLIERSFIRHFLSEGHDLVNIQGTQLRQHEIKSVGKYPKKLIPKLMYLERTKGK